MPDSNEMSVDFKVLTFQMVCNAIVGMKRHVYIPRKARSVTAVGRIGLFHQRVDRLSM